MPVSPIRCVCGGVPTVAVRAEKGLFIPTYYVFCGKCGAESVDELDRTRAVDLWNIATIKKGTGRE